MRIHLVDYFLNVAEQHPLLIDGSELLLCIAALLAFLLHNRRRERKRLDSLMQTDQLFIDPNLNRNALAQRLQTNSTYLSDAIRDGKNGKSVNEYINSFRLALARDLILNRPDLLISDIWAISGFASYRFFHQLFSEEYGMSPSDFRKKTKKAGL